MKVRWTVTAKGSYFNILEYLEESWSEKEVLNFISEVDSLLKQISINPKMFQESKAKRNIRKGFISKHTTLYYRFRPRKKELELLSFWDNRQDPNKLVY